MSGHHHRNLKRKHAFERADPAVEVAIPEPGKASVELKVAEEDDLALLQMDNDVAVTVGRSEVAQPDGIVRQVIGELIGECLGRRCDHDRVVVGQADPSFEPALCRIVFRHQFENVPAKQHAELGGVIGDGPALAGSRPKTGLERGQGVFVRQMGTLAKTTFPEV